MFNEDICKNKSFCIHGAFIELATTVYAWIYCHYGIVLLTLLAICIFYMPLHWNKELTDVGFKAIKTKNLINRSRRLRKLGEKIPPPFPNGWFSILESKEIKRGLAKSVDCLGENFVVFRSENNDVFVLNAYCTHMGANLGYGGIVTGNYIACPFHQWKFSGIDGFCVDIPYSSMASKGDVLKSANLKKWISFETNGFIFVWHHVETDVTPWTIPVVQEVETKKWIFHGRNEFYVNSHIQDIPENGADVAHLSAVHGPNLIGGGDISYMRSKWLTFGVHLWSAKWATCDTEKHLATMNLSHKIRFFGKLDVCGIDVRAIQIGPGYVQLFIHSNFGPMVIFQTVTPIEPFVQKVVHTIYAPRYTAWFAKFTFFGECVMFERDVAVWNHKMFKSSPILTKEDKQIKLFRNWYSQFYSENSLNFLAAKINSEW